jgi:hypothetical protein
MEWNQVRVEFTTDTKLYVNDLICIIDGERQVSEEYIEDYRPGSEFSNSDAKVVNMGREGGWMSEALLNFSQCVPGPRSGQETWGLVNKAVHPVVSWRTAEARIQAKQERSVVQLQSGQLFGVLSGRQNRRREVGPARNCCRFQDTACPSGMRGRLRLSHLPTPRALHGELDRHPEDQMRMHEDFICRRHLQPRYEGL